MNNLMGHAFALTMVGILVFLCGCGGTSMSPTPMPGATASFRFVQVNASAGAVDVMMDSSTLSGNVAFLRDTGYLTVQAGNHQLLVQPPGGSPKPFVNAPISFNGSTKNTYVLGGWGAFGTMGLPVLDDNSPPAASGIKLRIVDVVAQATNRDIYVLPAPSMPGGTPTFHPASIPFASSYLALPAGTYDVFVTAVGTTTVLFDSGPMTFTAGQNRTVVLLDDCTPTTCSFNAFRAVTLADLN
jgi:hypothetical protein